MLKPVDINNGLNNAISLESIHTNDFDTLNRSNFETCSNYLLYNFIKCNRILFLKNFLLLKIESYELLDFQNDLIRIKDH